MIKNGQAIAAIALAMALPFATTIVLAQDDEPVVNDYSNMGAEYNPSDDSGDDASGEDTSTSSDSDEKSASTDDSSADNASESGKDDGQLYVVECADGRDCKVGEDVMTGYEKFGSHCSQCHGQNAEGSTFAPSLVQRLKDMNQGRFTAAVAGGVTRMDSTTGQYSVMPAWSENKDVMNNLQQIWAFLRARSDGELPAGRPEPLEGNG
ncbi:c-type cytochrome [Salinisphaera orenii]|uniref:Cytochrome C n=1 Tax=Salinisphaera orenii YIM 95161 TaxID=1051139 RepID=A0A423PMJ0_9GAMM|nr:c-type cytochrome [Salinisphaera halophila]ROO26752.1 cytochrome C [Salinisphaera halophila YIM 95161]